MRPARLLLLLGVLASPVAAAEPASSVLLRVGVHPNFGRLVIELPKGAAYDIVTEGDRVLVVFQNAGPVAGVARLPRNVMALDPGTGSVTLELAPGAQMKSWRQGDRLVMDFLDPPGAARPRPAPPVEIPLKAEAPAPPPPVLKLPTVTRPGEAKDTAGPPKAPETAPAVPVQAQPLDHPPPPQLPPAAPVPPPAAILLPMEADVGAAAFRRGPSALVIFDHRLKLPGASALPGASVTQGVAATTVQFPLPDDQDVVLTRTAPGWSIALAKTAPGASLAVTSGPSGLSFPVPRPGRTVTVLDPVTGGTILVGTSLNALPEAAVPALRRTPDFAVLPTWLGVGIAALSDRVDLRAVPTGFVLSGAPALPEAVLDAPKRQFDLPGEPPDALMNCLQAQRVSAAAAAPRARAPDRIAAAQTLIALGMGVEAQALLQLTASEDPQAAADANLAGLAGIAAILAGRPNEADGIDDPRLDGGDEIALWRGIRDRRLGRVKDPQATDWPKAAALAAGYPATLRRLIAADIAEALVETGRIPAGTVLPPFAQALALERAGKTEDAIAAYQTIARGTGRLDQVRAREHLVELRLASGALTPAQAADAMERLGFAWRGDQRELGFRLRAAELRSQAGAWRAALDSLRETEKVFPDQKQAVQARKSQVFEAMLAANGKALAPLDLVVMATDYADCVPEGPAGATLAAMLADKLMALDLPARAIPVLQGLVRAAPAGPARAEIGLRLGQLLLDGGDAGGALAALAASAAPDLPSATLEARSLLSAKAQAKQGDIQAATDTLKTLGTAAADDLRARLLETAGDWRGSFNALADLAGKQVPATGLLNESQQEILLRQASAAAQLADAAALKQLAREAPRMAGPRSELFRFLTAAPVAGTAELPRSNKELSLARVIPERIQALGRP